MINKKNISLTHFIVSQVSLFLLVMTLLLSYLSYIGIKNQIETLIGQKIDYILTTQSLNAEGYLWNYDTEGLASIADSILTDPQILAIRILETNTDQPYTILDTGSVPFPRDNDDPSILSRKIVHIMPDKTEREVGLFQVYVDYKSVRTKIAYQVFIMATMAAIAYIVLLSVIYFALKKSIYPLTYLSEQLKTADADKFDLKRLPEVQTKEIETLFDAFETSQKKIYDHQQSLITSIEQAERANRIKDTFMANMSHELRTPLNSIIGMMRILREGKNYKDEQIEMMEIIDKSSDTLLTIVNDILDISKIESEKIVLEHRPFSLEELINDVTERFNTSEKVRLIVDTKSIQNISVLGDFYRLDRILTNLCGNAIKYTEEGHVIVHAHTKKTSGSKVDFVCSFEDTGIGIPANKIDTIFEKFTQAEDSITRRFGGTGLGLSITKHLVELMGGTIDVKSTIGKGSCFTVKIPFELTAIDGKRSKTGKGKSKSTSRKKTSSTIKKKKFSKAKVLIAEDHAFNQVLVKKLIERIGCDNSDLVFNGEEAITAFRGGAYDLILMDCHMPTVNGYEATEVIREIEKDHKTNSPVFILALTADAMVGSREKCIESGMNEYISKPIDEEVLRDIIEEWFDVS